MIRRTLTLCMACIAILSAFAAEGEADTLIIDNGGRKIFGLLHKPDARNNSPQPIAIIAHGFNGTHHYGKNYFEPLAEIGYRCYAFDFPSGSVHSASGNNTMNMSILDEKADLMAVIDYFRNSPEVDDSHIAVIGESQGGLVASLVASEAPEKIDKLILVFAALCIPDHHNGRFASEQEIPDTTYVWKVPLGKRFFAELRHIEPYANLAKYARPVLIIHGDKDPVVPLSYSERAVGVYPNATLKVIKDAGHGFGSDDFALSTRYITDFLTK